ncbi:MAG: RagB/SusD family nutrient uptake outer membrane protein [Bacteroidota bacterium]
MKTRYLVITILGLLLFGCNDEFMEKYPLDSITDQNFWNSESDLKIYCNSFYADYIKGFDGHLSTQIPYGYQGSEIPYGDIHSDNVVSDNYSTVDMINGTYIKTTAAGSGGWNWSNLRALNYFLDNYQRAEIDDDIKNIYAGEIMFFKTMEYFEKIKIFGEVPWYSKPLETDSEELFNPRTPRNELMDSVLSTINQAIEWLPKKGSEENGRINKDIALLLKARICLYEGTFRKYHTELNLSGDNFLQEAVNASNELINSGNYDIWSTGDPDNDYHNLFIQEDYESNSEIILWKEYSSGLLGHGFLRNFLWNQAQNVVGFSKSLVKEYLCIDGLPISTSELYNGDDSIQSEFLNRDPRLKQTICKPGEYALDPDNTHSFTNRGKGYNGIMPGIRGSGEEFPSPTGYWPVKFWKDDPAEFEAINTGTMPCPIFRYAEVLLINAEANAELSTCTQAVLDKTINKLRDRVGMPHLNLSNLPTDKHLDEIYNSYCGYVPSPLLREIRRERRVELAWENFRWDDLVRWKAGKLLLIPEAIRGMKFNQYQYPSVQVGTDVYLDSEGFLEPYQKSLPNGRTFVEPKQYYYPIPSEDIVLNKNLVQNPGWE